jgi:hypothetical protein
LDEQMPPQAMVAPVAFPVGSYAPTIQVGVGEARVFAPSDVFMD